MSEVTRIEIQKKPSFREEWYDGSIFYNKIEYKFWLVNPVGSDDGQEYAPEVRWWFKGIPREVRMLHTYIVESFFQKLNIN